MGLPGQSIPTGCRLCGPVAVAIREAILDGVETALVACGGMGQGGINKGTRPGIEGPLHSHAVLSGHHGVRERSGCGAGKVPGALGRSQLCPVGREVEWLCWGHLWLVLWRGHVSPATPQNSTQAAGPAHPPALSMPFPSWESPSLLGDGEFPPGSTLTGHFRSPVSQLCPAWTSVPGLPFLKCLSRPTGQCVTALGSPGGSGWGGPYLVGWAGAGAEGSGREGRTACWGAWRRAVHPETGSGRMVAAVAGRAPLGG